MYNVHECVGERLIRLPEVEAVTGMKKSALYAAMKRSAFPLPVKLSKRASAWRYSEIQAWIAARIRDSRGERS